MRPFTIFFGLTVALGSPAAAEMSVRFVEGAPKDKFIIENTANCTLPEVALTLNMQGSVGALVFDVTDAGAGVEVFQPFELVSGAQAVARVPQVRDGDRQIVLSLKPMDPGAQVAFTIDVDDTVSQREITVTGSEIVGAAVQVTTDGATQTALFDASARAVVQGIPCQA